MPATITLADDEVRLLKTALILYRNNRMKEMEEDAKEGYANLPAALKTQLTEENYTRLHMASAWTGAGYLGGIGFGHYHTIAKSIYSKLP